MTKYYCTHCKKQYACYQSYWEHNKNFHKLSNTVDKQNNKKTVIQEIPPIEQDISKSNNKSYKCKYCNKVYSHYPSKYRHQKICNNISKTIIDPSNEEQILNILDNINITPKIIEKINNLKNNTINNNNSNTINSNTINSNNTINNITNNIIINKVGYEDIYELTEEEVKSVLNNIYESIGKIVEVVNFNEKLPQNHSFCSTALNSPFG